MEGLKLNYAAMQECISDLQALPEKFPKAARPSASGKGQGADKIEKIADRYVAFYELLEQLTEDTAGYLKQMAAEFRETDEKRAKK